MDRFKYIFAIFFVLGFCACVFAETNHEQKTRSGRPIIDRKSQSIEPKKPYTEPVRDLGKEPTLICDVKKKDKKWSLVFDKIKGDAVVSLVEDEVITKPLAVMDCRRTEGTQIKGMECSTRGENGFLAKFSYPDVGVMRRGKFYEVNLGRPSSSANEIVCRNN
jgi:hypothetical protein